MGVAARRVKMFCFVLCAMLAGFGGIIQVFRLHSPLPSIGDGLELQAVAAAVIGGTSLYGGVGTVLGAIVGALLIRVIDNGLVMTQVDANWFKFAVGALLILAVVAQLLAAAHLATDQAGDMTMDERTADRGARPAQMVLGRACAERRELQCRQRRGRRARRRQRRRQDDADQDPVGRSSAR